MYIISLHKEPSKKNTFSDLDLVKNVMREHSRAFAKVFEEAVAQIKQVKGCFFRKRQVLLKKSIHPKVHHHSVNAADVNRAQSALCSRLSSCCLKRGIVQY